jgi:ankyrin repeat protein
MLYFAIESGCTECAVKLLDCGVDVNADLFDFKPLHVAAAYCRVDIMRILLERGANPNAVTYLVKNTPLHLASCAEAARLLLERGANIEARNDAGSTPLHLAAMHCQVDVARVLIEAGADVNARSNSGATPLHDASCRDVAELLIAYGARVDARDKYGDTPLHEAVRRDRCDVVEVLLKHGANPNEIGALGTTPLYLAKSECVRNALIKAGAVDNFSLFDALILLGKLLQHVRGRQ